MSTGILISVRLRYSILKGGRCDNWDKFIGDSATLPRVEMVGISRPVVADRAWRTAELCAHLMQGHNFGNQRKSSSFIWYVHDGVLIGARRWFSRSLLSLSLSMEAIPQNAEARECVR